MGQGSGEELGVVVDVDVVRAGGLVGGLIGDVGDVVLEEVPQRLRQVGDGTSGDVAMPGAAPAVFGAGRRQDAGGGQQGGKDNETHAHRDCSIHSAGRCQPSAQMGGHGGERSRLQHTHKRDEILSKS